jgi:hypothetical protein
MPSAPNELPEFYKGELTLEEYRYCRDVLHMPTCRTCGAFVEGIDSGGVPTG